MKISLAHMIPAPFAQHVAQGLEQAGHLHRFYCTLVDEPQAGWQQLARRLAPIAQFDLAGQLERRAIQDLPRERLRCYPQREALRMLIQKLRNDPVLGDQVFHWAIDGFERWVGRQLDAEDVLYGYEYVSRGAFRAAQQQGIRCVYDLPSPEHDFVENLLAPEFERFPELVTDYRKMTLSKQAERTAKRQEEWELASLVVANSQFTAQSWQAAGWAERPVAVVPYGAPPLRPLEIESFTPDPQKLRVIWAGTFSVRKGAHYVVEALQQLPASLAERIEVTAYGAVALPVEQLNPPASLKFAGSVAREQLFLAMQQSDVLLFPTLCDGFGLVVNEAFAQGLPVITTNRAGAADLLKDGENGYLIEAGSSQAIAEVLQRCWDERAALQAMRELARQTAADWQWPDYQRAVTQAIQTHLST